MERKTGIIAVCLVLVGGGLLARTIFVGGVTLDHWSDRPEQVAIGVAVILALAVIVLLVRRRRALSARTLRFENATRDAASALDADGEAAWTSGVGARRALSQPGAGIPTAPDRQVSHPIAQPEPTPGVPGQPLPPPSP